MREERPVEFGDRVCDLCLTHRLPTLFLLYTKSSSTLLSACTDVEVRSSTAMIHKRLPQ